MNGQLKSSSTQDAPVCPVCGRGAVKYGGVWFCDARACPNRQPIASASPNQLESSASRDATVCVHCGAVKSGHLATVWCYSGHAGHPKNTLTFTPRPATMDHRVCRCEKRAGLVHRWWCPMYGTDPVFVLRALVPVEET